MRREEKIRGGYRVDVQSTTTDEYESFSGRLPVTRAMADSLAEHLRRSKAGGRVVEVRTGEVVDEWARAYAPEDPNALRDRIQAMRDSHPHPLIEVEPGQ
jgi:hypothetical protein